MSSRPGNMSCGLLKAQPGMVLLLCLIFLMSLTLLGLSAASDTILQNKLAANLQENERARQSALLSLAWAEQWLMELDGMAPESCSVPCTGLNLHPKGDISPQAESESFSWWTIHGHKAGIDPLTGEQIATISTDSFQPPYWAIEVLRIIPPSEGSSPDLQVWYRILARGSGRTEKVISVIESTVVRAWPADDATEVQGTCNGPEEPIACGRYAWRELR